MRTLGNYLAIQKVLDAAIEAGGAVYRLPTKGAAVHWRQRAYKFRKLAQKASMTGQTPYDPLFLRIHDDEPAVVRIEFEELKGELSDLSGRPLTVLDTPLSPSSDLEREAQDLAKELGIDL